jgi:uncharacterized RDD family membrane protein YckC
MAPTVGTPRTTHAGVVTRLLAAGVDVVAVVLLTFLLDLAAACVRFVWSPMDFRWPRPATEIAVVVLLCVAVLYLTVAWAMTGRTYGGRLLGLRVLSHRGRLLGWMRSFVRAVASVLWPVGLLWSGVSPTAVPCRTSCSAPSSSTTRTRTWLSRPLSRHDRVAADGSLRALPAAVPAAPSSAAAGNRLRRTRADGVSSGS